MKSRLILLAKFTLAAGLIYWLIASDKLDFEDLQAIDTRWPWLIGAYALFGLVLFLGAIRWRLFLDAQEIRYSLREAYALTMIGFFFSQVMLGSTGGDMVKAYVVAREQRGRRSAALMTVIFDRVFGLLILLVVALGAIAFNFDLVRADAELAGFAITVGVVLTGALAACACFYSERIRTAKWVRVTVRRVPFQGFLSNFILALDAYKRRPRPIAQAAAISVVLHVLVILSVVCAAKALIAGPVSIAHFFFLIPLAHIAMALPLTPGSIGTGEAAYAFLLGRVGITQGSLVSLLMRLVYLGWAVIGCAFYLQRKTKVSSAVHEARSTSGGSPVPDERASDSEQSRTTRRGNSSGMVQA
ncbi:MAG: flippase-like domain-containing protein [Planctomycetes bacterium]|nr:flippase-like domain-containing protein [Planctomycetota bacterium]